MNETAPRARTVDGLAAETGRQLTYTDEFLSELHHRVTALEEILAARWPRRLLLAARARRDLRASVRHIGGHGFAARRAEALQSGWPPGR